MTEESDLKRELVRQCKVAGYYARRIEDQYGVGILDIVVVPTDYVTLFIEAKVTDGMKFGPTERQYVEGQRILAAKGAAMPILVGWRQKIMYVADWGREAFITRAFKQPEGVDYAGTIGAWAKWKTKQLQSES